MSRPTTKSELLDAAERGYRKMNEIILQTEGNELEIPFDFANDEKKKEAHWKRDKNLRDVLVHLYEWHRLLLKWVQANGNGESKPFLPEPYNWKTYGEMNVKFWETHQSTSLEAAKEMLERSHKEVMALAETFSDEELFTKGVFKWVGGSALGSYFISVTSSHYDWAMKKLKAHIKKCKEK